MTLVWSEVLNPTSTINYTHVKAETPLGVFVIDWKSWKENADYDVSLDDAYITSTFSLEHAKELCHEWLEKKYEELGKFLQK